jgi:retron-type reverse transcriptase
MPENPGLLSLGMNGTRSEAEANHLFRPIRRVLTRGVAVCPALKSVCANKGSPGVDGMTVDELKGYMKIHWPDIREKLLQGEYRPQPVKQVLLPKPGGARKLGVPTFFPYCTSINTH